MTHDPSRKKFFAKLFGSAAALSLLPKAAAKADAVSATGSASKPTVDRLVVRPDARAVARRADTV